MALKRMRTLLERARASGSVKGDPVETLRVLLEALLVLDDHLGRLQWLETLGGWIRGREPVPSRFRLPGEDSRSQRLRLFLAALKDYPAAREAFLRNLRHALLDTSGLKLFADTGLPSEYGFLSEATERVLRRVLPRPPDESNLSELLERMFTSETDASWIANLGPELLVEMARILFFEGNVERNPWRQIRLDMLDAITVLAADVASLGVSKDLLDRLPRGALRDLPFLVLTHECDFLVTAVREGEAQPDAVRQEHAKRVRRAVTECRRHVGKVVSHLETHGVSVHLVYRLEKLGAILDRLEAIVGILVPQEGLLTVRQVSAFVASLVRSIHDDRSVGSLVGANLRQLSRKVVERTGESGEHYIVRTRRGWMAMLRGAAGGGVLTVFTTIGKFVTAGHGLPLFVEGAALAINYAGSFLVMQFVGFKLATKQPSMFAAAIAGKLLEKRYLEDSKGFVEEVQRVTRSQTAAVLGNIGLVIPTALAFDALWKFARGNAFLDTETAGYAVASLDPLRSGTIFYAALTGVILMFSSLVGSWLENFVVFRRIPEAIAKNRRLVRFAGETRAEAISHSFLHGVSGVGVSITLGVMLGMTPVFGKFLGLPLDVRHVTLSTAQLSLGLSSLGLEALLTPQAALAMVGIVLVGFLNFGVSFALGLLLAIRAREVSVPATILLVRDTARAFFRHPMDFIFPPRRTDGAETAPDEDGGHGEANGDGRNEGHGEGNGDGHGGCSGGARQSNPHPGEVVHRGTPDVHAHTSFSALRKYIGATARPRRAAAEGARHDETPERAGGTTSRYGAKTDSFEDRDEPGFDNEPSPL